MKKILMIGYVYICMIFLSACSMKQEKWEKPADNTQQSTSDGSTGWDAPSEESEETALEEPELHMLLGGICGELGSGYLAYTAPEAKGEDYQIYFFKNETGNYQQSFAELELSVEDAAYVFPDVREGNASIGRFLDIYFFEITEVKGSDARDVIAVAKYEADGKEYFDTRIYVKNGDGYSPDAALIKNLNERFGAADEYPIEEIFVLCGEDNPVQPDMPAEDVVFFGSWYMTDYRTASIYALSQEEIDTFLTYTVAYYENGFFLNGMQVEAEAEYFGYSYQDYTKAEVEEQFLVDLTGWWDGKTAIKGVDMYAEETEESLPIKYCFGASFFAVDSETLLIYYEGVFFQAKRAGA